MPKNWRWKAGLALFSLLLSLYFLVPTLLQIEGSEAWYAGLFPEEKLQLGLDLQGGIYTELEVVREDAVWNRSDLITSEMERLLRQEPFAPEKIERVSDSSRIRLLLKKQEDEAALSAWILKNYKNVLRQLPSNEERTFLLDFTEDFLGQTRDLAVKQALENIRHRIDRYGVAEPSITRLGSNRIGVELPGMSDPERAMDLIKKSGKLEFKMLDETLTDEEVRKMVSEEREKLKLGEDFTEETVQKINQGLKEKFKEGSEVLFEIQHDPVTKKIVGGIPFLVKKKAEVTGDMLKNAQVNVENNEPYVSISFNPLGTKLFGELTKANVGKRLAIILDGTVSMAPVIRSEIPSGEAKIELGGGNYNSLLREAEDLTLVLREGALPARMKELTKTVVGPSLGADSIRIGVRTSLIAGLLVMIFMAVYYRFSGLLADIALLLNILFILGALSLFQASLTLPGIAGIVLTIGMAVDANVLIFERIREEVRGGKSARSALELGYSNAMSAILDSNITTFLAGVVLYQYGTGPIRGFAVTLMIGILTTLFTAIIVTRLLQDWYVIGLKKERVSV
ncbi:MAG: protein translocase subunit SecD [Deltaproteobacteria bacterium]|nr:protein translocase subunit SecD [Deltaproteobacteria bacterium]MBI4373692.1 protein translocase subunit SecD [Deltaproteobacteria bacterium]